jgi:hypothetical protein
MACDEKPHEIWFGGTILALRKTLWILAGAAPVAALAASNPSARHNTGNAARPAPIHLVGIHLVGDVFVERLEPAPGGRTARVLEHVDSLHSGDRLVFVVSWRGGDPAGFTVTNPVPRSIAFQAGTGFPDEEVSVDDGRTWGPLADLVIHDGGGWRHALPGDVTQVRWRVQGDTGQIAYRGVVR